MVIGKRKHQRRHFHQPHLNDLIVLRRRNSPLHSCTPLAMQLMIVRPNFFSTFYTLPPQWCRHGLALVRKLLPRANGTKRPIMDVQLQPYTYIRPLPLRFSSCLSHMFLGR